jgi:hypothetical protein
MAKTATRKSTASKKTSSAGGRASMKSSSSGSASGRARRKTSSKRVLIDTGTDKRYVRRSAGGQFKESDDVSRSLSKDIPRKAKTKAPKGQGDRGD